MEEQDALTSLEQQIAATWQGEQEQGTTSCLEQEAFFDLVEQKTATPDATEQMKHIAFCTHCRRRYMNALRLLELVEEVGGLETAGEAAYQSIPNTRQLEEVPQSSYPGGDASQKPVTPAPAATDPSASRTRGRYGFLQAFYEWRFSTLALGSVAVALTVLLLGPWNSRATSKLVPFVGGYYSGPMKEKYPSPQQLAKKERVWNAEKQRLNKIIASLKEQQRDPNPKLQRLRQEYADLTQAARLFMAGAHDSGHSQASPDTIMLLQPRGQIVLTLYPALRCNPLPGASAYQFTLKSTDPNEILPILVRLSPTHWQVQSPLRAGQWYQWSVSASKDGRIVVSPTARFQAWEQGTWERARQQYAQFPLTLGVFYMQAGKYEEAKQQFQTILKRQPDHPIARSLMRDLPGVSP